MNTKKQYPKKVETPREKSALEILAEKSIRRNRVKGTHARKSWQEEALEELDEPADDNADWHDVLEAGMA